MEHFIKEPSKSLSENIKKVWVIREIIENLIGFLVLGVLFFLDNRFDWLEWIGWGLTILLIVSVLFAIWGIGIKPIILHKTWGYDVNEEFLQLKHGAITEERELIPMTKIQAVSTKQGPLMKRYGLYSISIETMGSSHSIPGISKEIAQDLRDQIAIYAKVKEVE
ncbi:PH domain-containing protein [Radiobacillus deserti]|uniref:PH domain-containing protein n=1 Tax=Radiobacillus deserti TaxID=2594883 RepID=A0A516KEV5_9BACI|nr:PH domain-containing protein [Radiobacillus deserti]QDP39919.1 PH domain-containing protein [Radiobacillus deserti]